MNWDVFKGFFALPFCRLFRIGCLKDADIVIGAGAKYSTFTIPKGDRSKVWRHF